MVQILALVLFILWLPQSVAELLNYVYWLQVKEYRLDRFKSFVRSHEGRQKLSINYLTIKYLLLIVAIFLPVFVYPVIIYSIVLLILSLLKLRNKYLRKPAFTDRAIKITLTGIVCMFVLIPVWLVTNNIIFTLLIGEIYILVAPLFGIAWTTPLVDKAKIHDVGIAVEKLKAVKPIVIGITGSYGKTTTKEFVYQLLVKKYKTEKTIKNQNTDFGIARKIINEFPETTQVFVVEMGAYRKGDIKNLTDIFQPNIAILTGIEPQHLDLFGSLGVIKSTKFELIESLHKNDLCFFNVSDKDVLDLYHQAKVLSQKLRVHGYCLLRENEKPPKEADMWGSIISADWEKIKFIVQSKNEKQILTTQLKGVHLVENLIGAISVARSFKVSWKDITEAVAAISAPESTMTVKEFENGSILIDDSYNSTPKSFEAALKYLELFKNKKKVVITPGIIELGKLSETIHNHLGNIAATIVDGMYVTNAEPAKYFRAGFSGIEPFVIEVTNNDKLKYFINKEIDNQAVILLEGRLPQNIINFIYKRTDK